MRRSLYHPSPRRSHKFRIWPVHFYRIGRRLIRMEVNGHAERDSPFPDYPILLRVQVFPVCMTMDNSPFEPETRHSPFEFVGGRLRVSRSGQTGKSGEPARI